MLVSVVVMLPLLCRHSCCVNTENATVAIAEGCRRHNCEVTAAFVLAMKSKLQGGCLPTWRCGNGQWGASHVLAKTGTCAVLKQVFPQSSSCNHEAQPLQRVLCCSVPMYSKSGYAASVMACVRTPVSWQRAVFRAGPRCSVVEGLRVMLG